MSYLALARKWRPTRFTEVVGQAHVLTALENALAHNRLHHAYLFSGTRGVGKTTIGRLFAKGLNCETGITSTPCGVCDTCREIDQGRFVDLLEIDAASRTKVEDTRELLDNVQYKPARGRFKVYLIDEVHMLSRHSFNALLKTLEEPPEYVKFLLATTDPQKLPVTILSRCLQFHLKPISTENIQAQLEHILKVEQVEFESRALGMIAHAADGSMRDAQSLTDQAIALGNGVIQSDVVSHMLGTLDTDQALHLLQAISGKQPDAVMKTVETIAQNGVEWDALLQQVGAQLHRIAMYQALPATLDKAQPDAEKVQLLSQALAPQDVQLYYQIVLKGRADLPMAPTPRIGLEMTLLRMLAFRPAQVSVVSHISTESVPSSQAYPHSQPPSQPLVQSRPQTEIAENVHVLVNTTPVDNYSSIPSQPMPQPATSQGQQPIQNPSAAVQSADQPHLHQQTTQLSANEPAARPGAAGLRHQLRSQRKGLGQQKSSDSKKSEAASVKPQSVLERVAQKHGSSGQQMPPARQLNEPVTAGPEEDEPYQWRPSQPVIQVTKTKELTPAQLKKALEHEKTPEMAAKLIKEAIEQDEWSALIQDLNTAKLVEQLALNSVFSQQGNSITLTLRHSQAHLNTDRAQQELQAALNHALGAECALSVTIGEEGETPLEIRKRLYQEKLTQAHQALEQDPNIQFIEKRFNAELDRESVRPI